MVDAQKRLVEHLGISRLYSIAGGSMGGFQVLEWSLRYPQMVRSAICIASASRLSTQAIAFNAVGRSAITRDPDWRDGQYTGKGPEKGFGHRPHGWATSPIFPSCCWMKNSAGACSRPTGSATTSPPNSPWSLTWTTRAAPLPTGSTPTATFTSPRRWTTSTSPGLTVR